MKVTKAVRVVAPVLAETTKKKGETKPLQAVLPRVSIRAQDAPGSVSDGVKRAATEREQAVLRGVEARVATVLAEHAGTIAIASQPLTDLEASAVRRARRAVCYRAAR